MKKRFLSFTLFSLLIFLTLISAVELSPDADTEVSVIVDGEFPLVEIFSPQNITYTEIPILINFTVIETSLDSIWYSLDSGKNTSVDIFNYSFLYTTPGSHHIIFYANDSAGRQNSSEIYFSYDDFVTTPGGGGPGESGGSGGSGGGGTSESEEDSGSSENDSSESGSSSSSDEENPKTPKDSPAEKEISVTFPLKKLTPFLTDIGKLFGATSGIAIIILLILIVFIALLITFLINKHK